MTFTSQVCLLLVVLAGFCFVCFSAHDGEEVDNIVQSMPDEEVLARRGEVCVEA